MLTSTATARDSAALPPVVVPALPGRHPFPRWTTPVGRLAPRICPAEKHAREENPQANLLLSLLPLVHRVARSVRRHLPAYATIQADDLVSAGTLGLMDALRKYDARRQTCVEHYVIFRIRGAMLDSLRDWDCAPRPLRRISKALGRAARELEVKLGRAAEDTELAGALGMTLERWHEAARALGESGLSGRASVAPAGTTRPEMLRSRREAQECEMPFDACARRERSALVAQALDALPQRECQVVLLYYQDDLTQKQIGARLSLSEARVCQLRQAALHRLRKGLLRTVHSSRYLL